MKSLLIITLLFLMTGLATTTQAGGMHHRHGGHHGHGHGGHQGNK